VSSVLLPICGLGFGLGLSLCILYGLLLGYPPRRFTTRLLNRKEQAVVAACAEALFPARDPMPLTGIEAGIVEYFDGHLLTLPADKRLQIRALLWLVEHSPWIFAGSRRFSALPPERREAFLADMAMSRFYLRRLCFVSLRTLLCFAYFANPVIAARLGCTPNTRPFEEGLP
jgi:hypothetical protein